MKKLFILLCMLLGIGIIAFAGMEIYYLNKSNNNINQLENNKTNQEKTELDKDTKEEKEKLSKLDNINEKIDYFNFKNIDRYISYQEKNNELSIEDIILHVNIGIDNDFYSNTQASINPDSHLVLVNKYYYLTNDYIPKDLETINSKYSSGNRLLQHDARLAFESLAQQAALEGYTIRAMSTYRSFDYQKGLYDKYVSNSNVETADTFSARPGHSEHQTGLALDVDNGKVSYTSFGNTKEFIWMKDNAHKFGFILRYTQENQYITGYVSEAWHYRYVGVDVATTIYNEKISSLEEYYVKYIEKDI